MRAAVTGAGGFIGQHLIPQLRAAGWETLSLSRANGFDIRDRAACAQVPRFDTLIHLAAHSFVPDSYTDPYTCYDTNVGGTLNMLELARAYKARVIFMSSYVYGQPQYLPVDEAHPVQAFNPYAQSKIIGEELCGAYSRDFGLRTLILRPFNIFGPGQPAHFLIPKIMRQIIAGEEIVLADARPRRDYVFVSDIVTAVIAALSIDADIENVINLGSGMSHSIPDILHMLERITGRKLEVSFQNIQRPAEILDTVCNNTRAANLLHWRPQTSLESGLRTMLQNLKP